MSEIVPQKAKVEKFSQMLQNMKGQLQTALPRHLTPDRMVRIALTNLRMNPDLLDCTSTSVAGCVMQSAQLGLELGVQGQAYMIPYIDRKTGTKIATFIPGYKGLVNLAHRSGAVSTIFAEVVHEKDRHLVLFGTDPKIEHVPTQEAEPGPVIAAYAVCKLKDGGTQFVWMWRRELDAIRRRSRAANSGPWVTDEEEMQKKTVARRLCKWIPSSTEWGTRLAQAVAIEEAQEAGVEVPLDLGPAVEVVDAREEPKPETVKS